MTLDVILFTYPVIILFIYPIIFEHGLEMERYAVGYLYTVRKCVAMIGIIKS